MKLKFLLTTLILISICSSQYLIISYPSDLGKSFDANRIKVISSPIGFKPKAGTIHGKFALAQPLSACNEIQQVQLEEQEDIFIMADDNGCLQSMKAHNLAASGAYIGIIKRNINNTLHDKTVDLVHIPILEIDPTDYDTLISYIQKNPNTTITMLADFNSQITPKKINMELWLSPTQEKAYSYILQFWKFITKQTDFIQFYPRFVLHSQTNRKQYIGCYSSGKFCPPQLEFQGKPEGSKIVGEALRQIIIANKITHKWFDYASFYYKKCLKSQNISTLWQQENSELCSQIAMVNAQIDADQIMDQYNKSFQGFRPEVDGNLYLEEQRQLYISQKITKFPMLLINGKQYGLEDPTQMKSRICIMIHPDVKKQPGQCQKLTNPPLFTTAEILYGVGIMLSILIVIMCICKQTIYRKMKKEMQGEVDKTLSQYYRYMESFQEPDPNAIGKVPLMEPKIQTNQIGSVELSEIKPTNK